VYQGAPTPFTGYMAAVAKAAGFAGLVRILIQAFATQQVNWRPVIWFLAVVTLLVGSVLAIVQRDLKRMLAYSSISQAGYVLIGLQAGTARGVSGVSFYLFTYMFIIAGTFAVVQLIQGQNERRNDLGAVRGLAGRSPLLAFSMTVLLLAQAGVPLTSGFLGKFYVIQAVVAKGQYALAIIGMLAAAIAAFFYLRIALLMYSSPSDDATETDGVLTAGLDTGLSDSLLVSAGLPLTREGVPAGASPGPGAVAASEPASGRGGSSTVALLPPAEGKVEVPPAMGLVILVCVAFTIFAGVTPWIVDLARNATLAF
jgi:NADH-quinone oxidoreductase subunit N